MRAPTRISGAASTKDQGWLSDLIDYMLEHDMSQIMLENGRGPYFAKSNVSQVRVFDRPYTTDQIKQEVKLTSQNPIFRRDPNFPPTIGVFWYRERQFAIDIFELMPEDSIRVYITHMNPYVKTPEQALAFKRNLVAAADEQDRLDAIGRDQEDDDIPLDAEIVEETVRPQRRNLTDKEREILVTLLERVMSAPIEVVKVDKDDHTKAPFLRGLSFLQRRPALPGDAESDVELERIIDAIDPRK